MASTPKGPKKMKLDYTIDRGIYDEFVKKCTSKGFSQQVVIERLMKKYIETGQA